MGAAFYAIFRSPLTAIAALGISGPLISFDVGSWQHALPTAIHVIGMSLLTIGVLNCRRWPAVALAAGGWSVTNIGFEMLQSDLIFGLPPLLPGVFDPNDVLASVAGGALAVLIGLILATSRPPESGS